MAAATTAGVLPRKEAEILVPAYRLYQSLFQVLRLCVEGRFEARKAPAGLLTRLAAAGELPDFATLDAALRDSERAVRRSFERILGKVPPVSAGRD